MKRVSEISISYKPKVRASERYTIHCSKDAYELLIKEAFNADTLEYKEYLKLILLNNANKVLGITTISEGGMDSTIVDVRLILQTALLAHCSNIILAHNHPTGSIQPSNYDDVVTKKIQEAAKQIDIKLYDHLIVTKDNYYSYSDERKIRQ